MNVHQTLNNSAMCDIPQTRYSRSIRWRLRSGIMLGIACITSPCCTPLIVPLTLGLFVGTPFALWVSHNLGLVFGGLTLISVMSGVLGFLWMSRKEQFEQLANRDHEFEFVPMDMPVLTREELRP